MASNTGGLLKGFFTKILLFALVASFALWGVGDIFRGNSGDNYAAKIGTEVVGANEFQQEYQFRLNNFRQLLGDEFSPEMSKKLGIAKQVLNELINRKLIEMEAHNKGIIIPQEEIFRLIRNNSSFQSAGTFDKQIFQQSLRGAGITEEQYMNALNQENAVRLLLNSFNAEPIVPEKLAEVLFNIRNETREATMYIFGRQSIEKVAAPDTQTLEAFYDKRKESYRTPEFRKLAYLSFDREKLRSDIAVNKETLHQLYEERKLAYAEPEKREVSQLLYTKKEDAIHALEKLQSKQSLEDVASQIPTVNQATKLGYVTQNELLAEAQETVFSLAEGEYSNPIETSFGWHIFTVSDIKSERVPAFEEMEAKLKAEYQESQLEEKTYQLSLELEDMIAGGAAFEDAAKEHGSTITETVFFDANGSAMLDEAVYLPEVENIIDTAFSDDIENAPQFLTDKNGNFYFIKLAEIEESRVPEMESVRQTLTTDWMLQETNRRIMDKANQVATALQKGDLSLLENSQFEMKKTGKTYHTENREQPESPISSLTKQALFELKPDSYSNALPADEGRFLILKLEKVTPAKKADKTSLEAIGNTLNQDYQRELEEQYLEYLRGKYPVKINGKVIESLT